MRFEMPRCSSANESSPSGFQVRSALLGQEQHRRYRGAKASGGAFCKSRTRPWGHCGYLSLASAFAARQLDDMVSRLRSLPNRNLFPMSLGVAILLGFVGILLMSIAVNPVVAAEEQPESFVTRLHPGDNLVGWTAQSAQIQSIFDAVPEIRHVWVWDSNVRRWRFAAPSVPARLWTLETLTPGMGLRIRLGGQLPVDWQRLRRPAQGTVALSAGWNLVAWMGRSDAPLDRVARGIGRSLRAVTLRTPANQTLHWQAGQHTSGDDQMRLRHGQAVWVNVDRAVRWLQPTGMLPEIIIAGSVSAHTEQDIRTDMQQVVDYYYETFGLEADFSRFQVYVPTNIDALVDARQQHLPIRPDPDSDRSIIAISWGSFGWASTDYMVVKADLWTSASAARQGSSSISRGQSVAEHEYAHVLQFQLSGQSRMPGEEFSFTTYGVPDLYPPSWVMEGMAVWIGYVHQAQEGGDWAGLRRRARTNAFGGQPLAAAERSTDVNYVQGTAAAFQLANIPSDDGLFELFRSVGRSSLGSAQQLTTFIPWRTAFANVFSMTLEDFYSSYDQEHEVGGKNLGIHTHKHAPPLIAGSIVGSPSLDGQYVKVGIWPTAVLGVASWDWVVVGQNFELSAQVDEIYNMKIEFTDPPCVAYLANGDLTQDRGKADELQVLDVSIVHMMVPLRENPCNQMVRLRVETEAGQALPGVGARFLVDGSPFAEGLFGLTDEQGVAEFHVWPRTSGDVEVVLNDICGAVRVGRLQFDGSLDPVERTRSGSSIAVSKLSDGTLRVIVADDWCTRFVKGQLRGASGAGIGNALVAAHGDDGVYVTTRTESSGEFRLNIPGPGAYRVSARIDGCTIYYGGQRSTGSYLEAELVDVGEAGDIDIAMRLSEGMCERRLSGRLLNSDGTPRDGELVRAFSVAGNGAGASVPDGSFSILVPGGGSYGLSVWFNGCWIYLGEGGPTSNIDRARRIEISGRDAAGIVFQLPESPYTFCD